MLMHKIQPLKRYLERDGLHELHADRFMEVFLVFPGKPRRCVLAPELDETYWWGLARAIANEQDVTQMERRPYFRVGIPTKKGSVRLTLSLGPTIRSGIMCTARRITPGRYTIDEFGLSKTQRRLFVRAVESRWNIMISGAMDSGKTSFMNALIKLVPAQDRVATIQDVPELVIDEHFESYTEYQISMLDQAHSVTYQDILDALTRGSYHRIWLGEANISNTWMMLRAADLGLGGFIGTIHADSAQLSLGALATNCRFKGYDYDASYAFFLERFHLFAHIKRGPDGFPRLDHVYTSPRAEDELLASGVIELPGLNSEGVCHVA